MATPSRLQQTIDQLLEAQRDDQRLRDHLEGLTRDEEFPGLTWFWGPLLYERNKVMFRGLILNSFSDWAFTGKKWHRVKWSDHAKQLESWLDAARRSRDTPIVRRLLRWKYADNKWGLDEKAWNAALVDDYQQARGPAARAIVLDEYDDWFQLDQPTAVALYQTDRACGPFVLKHLPHTFWGGEKRELWQELYDAAKAEGDQELCDQIYRKQASLKQWRADAIAAAKTINDPDEFTAELQRIHPEGYGLKRSDTALLLLEERGREAIPYVRANLRDLLGGWWGGDAKPYVKLAASRGWWDLWAAAIRTNRDAKMMNKAVGDLLDDQQISDGDRTSRLGALAGVSREWNWGGFGFAQIHALEDNVAVRMYDRYPEMIHGPFKPNVTPTWWQGYPELLAAAQRQDDDELVDLMASRYATQIRYEHAYYGGSGRNKICDTADALGGYYQEIRDRDPQEFARRAANVLTRIPAFAIHSYPQLLKTNQLARLLFVRSFDAYLEVPSAVRDLVEGSEIRVQMLAYRVLAQDDSRARELASDSLDILLGTLLRPLHRKTRMAAFGALANAARHDIDSARRVLDKAKLSLRLPDQRYPKEQLVGLIGTLLHERPELRGPREQPVVYGLEEVAG